MLRLLRGFANIVADPGILLVASCVRLTTFGGVLFAALCTAVVPTNRAHADVVRIQSFAPTVEVITWSKQRPRRMTIHGGGLVCQESQRHGQYLQLLIDAFGCGCVELYPMAVFWYLLCCCREVFFCVGLVVALAPPTRFSLFLYRSRFLFFIF